MAERISEQTGQTTRVVGWYHSHPHITVLPSHVDVRTQGQYQQMDAGFIGLIFSVFNQDSKKLGHISVTAFQSIDVADPPPEPQGGGFLGLGGSRPPPHSPVWMQKEVPLRLGPSQTPSGATPATKIQDSSSSGTRRLPLTEAMEGIALQLQDILFQEERKAFLAALPPDSANFLKRVHSVATYQRALCRLLDHLTLPIRPALAARIASLDKQVEALSKENERLKSQLTPDQMQTFQSRMASGSASDRLPKRPTALEKSVSSDRITRAEVLEFIRTGSKLKHKSSNGQSEKNFQIERRINLQVSSEQSGSWILKREGEREALLLGIATGKRKLDFSFVAVEDGEEVNIDVEALSETDYRLWT
eukprot:CAMPEP_0113950302 /NCGR_PEP_ID=MMETSP1339-20121228/80216_1 /TAXON_ID=94617 /ORGANISM="Fibrocapsa japonica" /LENGTH=361 /DNA_ID=CAMNT_0000958105 /DNA_START=23 /DNA_END=1105 /DNA_ORIENTATION=- /assembly_acc=CAM_ASM_000762